MQELGVRISVIPITHFLLPGAYKLAPYVCANYALDCISTHKTNISLEKVPKAGEKTHLLSSVDLETHIL